MIIIIITVHLMEGLLDDAECAEFIEAMRHQHI